MAQSACIARGRRRSPSSGPISKCSGPRACARSRSPRSKKNSRGGQGMAVETKVIERVITIDAPPETVFRLLTDPVQYVRWKGRLAELEPRRGGGFRVEFGSAKDIAAGKYVEVVRDRRVVFTWGWEGNEMVPPGSSTVEIDLQPMGSGTRLRLVHRGLPQEAIASHTEGWDYFLPRLTDVAEGRPAREAPQHTESTT